MDTKKEEVRVLLYPVDDYDREQAEDMENKAYTMEELKRVLPEDVISYSLADFMNECNDQEIELEGYWLSYIRVEL
jgi:hypothetical protein